MINKKIIFSFILLSFVLISFVSAEGNFFVGNKTSPSQNYFTVNGTTGRVGIGTDNPSTNFEIGAAPSYIYGLLSGKANIIGTNYLINDTQKGTLNVESNSVNAGSNSGLGPSLTFTQDISQYVSGYEKVIGGIKSYITTNTNTFSNSAMGFYTNNNTGLYERMTISDSGNVGIGTTTPNQKLQVVGNANVTSTLYVDTVQLTGGCCGTGINFNNENMVGLNTITISDSGAGEGFQWADATWSIDNSPIDRSNSVGNLNLYGTAYNIAFWRPTMFVYNSTNYAMLTQQSNGVSLFNTTGSRFDVATNVNVTGNLYVGNQQIGSGLLNSTSWNRSGTNVFLANTGDNVGIGTTSPLLKNHILGTSGYPANSGTTPNGILAVTSDSPQIGLYFGVANGSPYGSWIQSAQTANLGNEFPLLLNPNGGYVGIGTNTPTQELEVNGDILLGNSLFFINATNNKIYVDQNAGTGFDFYLNNQNIGSLNRYGTANGQMLVSQYSTGNTADNAPAYTFIGDTDTGITLFGSDKLSLTTGGDTKLLVDSSGYVGIGTTSPGSILDIRTSASANGALRINSSVAESTVGYYSSSSNDAWVSGIGGWGNTGDFVIGQFAGGGTSAAKLLIEDTTGYVGIGTNTPSNILHTNSSDPLIIFQDSNSSSYATTNVSLQFNNNYATVGQINQNGERLTIDSTGSVSSISLKTNSADRVLVDNSGRVGINTTTPQNTLNVVGDANVTGTLYTGNADFNGGWTNNGVSIINGNVYAKAAYFYNITGLDVTTLKINGSLLPANGFDNTFDIGNSTLRWRNAYLSGNANINGLLTFGSLPANSLNNTYFAANSVNARVIAASSVNTTHIVDGTILAGDIAANAINSTHIATGAIINADIAANAINNTQIVDGTILETDIAQTSSLDNTEIADIYLFNTGDTMSGQLTMSGSSANIALGSNYLSGDGGDEGVFVNSAGNVGIGTNSPNSKLSLTGGMDINQGNINHYRNVLHYGTSSSSVLGTMKITLPKNWSATMMTVKISGYQYASNMGAWEVIISGYDYNGGGGSWINYKAEIRGRAPFNSVRLGWDSSTNKTVILLGNTSTSWIYPQIAVTDFIATYGSATGWGSGWAIANTTSEATITSIVTPVIDMFTSSAGNVGIGTTSPSSILHLKGTSGSTTALTFTSYAENGASNQNATITYSGAGSNSLDIATGYNSNSNKITLSPKGTTAMTLLGSGYVGIGTATPQNPLNVIGNANVTGDLYVQGGDISITNNNGGIDFNDASAYWLKTATNWGLYWNTSENQLRFNGAGTTRAILDLDNGAADFGIGGGNFTVDSSSLFVDSSANRVGVGTTSPSQKLDVAGNANIQGNVILSTGTNRYVRLGSSTNYYYDLQSTGDDFQIIEAGDANKVRLHIDYPNGYMGINITSPTQRLSVGTGDVVNYLALSDERAVFGYTGNHVKIGSNSSKDIKFYTNATQIPMTILSSNGNVGIGTTSPATLLELANTSSVTAEIGFRSSEKWWKIGTRTGGGFAIRDSTNTADRLYIDTSGNVGIGTTGPAKKLTLTYNSNQTTLNANAGASVTEGMVIENTNTTTNSYSFLDLRANNGDVRLASIYNGTTNYADFAILTDGGGLTERMRVTREGNVGINTTTPQNTLNVLGTANITGSMIIGNSNITTLANGDVNVW